eukprot:2735507-Pleurochrysis_carterae.AAC.3
MRQYCGSQLTDAAETPCAVQDGTSANDLHLQHALEVRADAAVAGLQTHKSSVLFSVDGRCCCEVSSLPVRQGDGGRIRLGLRCPVGA